MLSLPRTICSAIMDGLASSTLRISAIEFTRSRLTPMITSSFCKTSLCGGTALFNAVNFDAFITVFELTIAQRRAL